MSTANPILPLGASPNEPFEIQSRPPGVGFLTSRGVQPPGALYVTNNDDLICGCATSQTNEMVTVSYRLLRASDGQLVLGQFAVLPANTRAIAVHAESLTEGFLLTASCKAAVATTRGQTFARIFLSDPSLGGGQPSYMLMADYVTTAMAPAHPNGRVLAPSEGPGNTIGLTLAAQPPGAALTISVPFNTRWIAKGLQATLVTSAAVGNRVLAVQFVTVAVIAFLGFSPNAQAPSTTCIYSGAQITAAVSPDASIAAFPLPPNYILRANDTIIITGTGLAPADQLSGGNLNVEEWLDNV